MTAQRQPTIHELRAGAQYGPDHDKDGNGA